MRITRDWGRSQFWAQLLGLSLAMQKSPAVATESPHLADG
jgi:hypothetical protein